MADRRGSGFVPSRRRLFFAFRADEQATPASTTRLISHEQTSRSDAPTGTTGIGKLRNRASSTTRVVSTTAETSRRPTRNESSTISSRADFFNRLFHRLVDDDYDTFGTYRSIEHFHGYPSKIVTLSNFYRNRFNLQKGQLSFRAIVPRERGTLTKRKGRLFPRTERAKRR